MFITKVIYWQHFHRWTGFTFTNLEKQILKKKYMWLVVSYFIFKMEIRKIDGDIECLKNTSTLKGQANNQN